MQNALRFAQDTSKDSAKYPAPQGIPQIPFRDQGKRNRGAKLAMQNANSLTTYYLLLITSERSEER
ncbi:hypothetical protein L6386_02660 [bacterium]|nr:hypothetical protein [bacterium]